MSAEGYPGLSRAHSHSPADGPDHGGPVRKDPRVPQLTVLVDGTAVPRELGGVGRYVEGVVSHLTDPALDVHLVVRPVHASHFAAVAPHATVHTAPGWTDSVPLRFLWEQTGLPALGRRLGANVLHSPHYTFPFAWRGGSVVTLHDATFFSNPEWHSRLKRTFFTWWSRRSLRSRPVVIVPSAATATEAARVVSGIRADVRVAPLGVDRAVFHEPSTAEVEDARIAATLPEGAPWIAFLGTIEPRKNVTALLDAYAAVRSARTTAGADTPWLVLSGARGWDESAITRLDALQPDDRVIEAGYLPLEDLAGYLGGAEFVVYPSLGEGFGLPVVEAMASGACVLTTRRLSLPEVGGDAAVYTEPSAPALADAMAALLDDPALVASHRTAALARAAAFTWEATAAVHVAAYSDVARVAPVGGLR
ncbi:glycosyltransferase involved in cell wall biosynthesis [Curtobacterium sp. AB7]